MSIKAGRDHICVCICTFQRLEYLKRLLEALTDQETGELFTYSILVVDNDKSESARPLVSDLAAGSPVPIRYCVEPRQNIARARNKAVQNAAGDFMAFIDDDELPIRRWLLTLFNACREYRVDGVLGPVKPHFDETAPAWVMKGKFYQRPTYPTGLMIDDTKGRTGNVLLKKKIFEEGEAFRPEFRTGEDQDFFRRMLGKGYHFIWCNEAVAYEVVPATRWKRSFMLKRALLRGSLTPLHPTFGAREIAKSIVAIPAYAIALPFALLLGQHRVMNLLIRLCDHLGRLLALAGIRPIKAAYVTE